jgi:hypothetical protein
MAWIWQFERADGTVITPLSDSIADETFSSQGDAESWIGEMWRDLLDSGVDAVTLLEDGRTEYGPMSLHPSSE